MYGQNDITKPHAAVHDGMALDVVEMFRTIQGEGPFAGQGAVFLRLAGCNLRCFWCDTDFSTNVRNLHIDHIIECLSEQALGTRIDLVVITGGEPLLQNIAPIVKRLLALHWRVQIETAGTCWVDGLPEHPDLTIVCSPKTPAVDKHVALRCHHWKYVIDGAVSQYDGLPVMSTQHDGRMREMYRCDTEHNIVYVQPCDRGNPDHNERNLRLAVNSAQKHGYILSLQQHKIIGVE